MKRIVLTGGGTAGHVSPNQALIPHLLDEGWDIHYIGTKKGIERSLIEPMQGVTYHAVSSGKLRRYFDWQNFTDPFRVIAGAFQSIGIIGKLKPDVVFSKGGFVSVPVVFGAAICGVPVVMHESDITPGLANKLCKPFAKSICTTFPECAKLLAPKGVQTGTPLRAQIFSGDRARGLKLAGFDGGKPVLMMIGGSLGAQSVNAVLRAALPELTKKFDVLHVCGKGNLDASLVGVPVVSVWGATHPFAGFYGFGQDPSLAVQLDMACRPCSVYGNKPCLYGTYACMSGIPPEAIVEKVCRRLGVEMPPECDVPDR